MVDAVALVQLTLRYGISSTRLNISFLLLVEAYDSIHIILHVFNKKGKLSLCKRDRSILLRKQRFQVSHIFHIICREGYDHLYFIHMIGMWYPAKDVVLILNRLFLEANATNE